MKKCDRCKDETSVTRGSWFNTDMICNKCDAKERAHPDYQHAKSVEMTHVRNGNFNFEGIGLPKDL